MELSKESVDAHRKLLKNPSENGLPFRAINQCFEKTDIATPAHLLFQDFKQEVPALQKVFFYIIMDEEYPDQKGKAPNGDMGYFLKFIPTKKII